MSLFLCLFKGGRKLCVLVCLYESIFISIFKFTVIHLILIKFHQVYSRPPPFLLFLYLAPIILSSIYLLIRIFLENSESLLQVTSEKLRFNNCKFFHHEFERMLIKITCLKLMGLLHFPPLLLFLFQCGYIMYLKYLYVICLSLPFKFCCILTSVIFLMQTIIPSLD